MRLSSGVLRAFHRAIPDGPMFYYNDFFAYPDVESTSMMHEQREMEPVTGPRIGKADRARVLATAGGFGAILLWSTTIAVARSLSEQLGPVTAAAAWAFYSVLACRWDGGSATGGVDLFLPATALVLILISFGIHELRAWSMRSVAETRFLGMATCAAYGLWDTAMRTGNLVLVAAGSNLTPLLSTMASCLYLAVAPGPDLWLGCALLVAGSLLSLRSVSDGAPSRPA